WRKEIVRISLIIGEEGIFSRLTSAELPSPLVTQFCLRIKKTYDERLGKMAVDLAVCFGNRIYPRIRKVCQRTVNWWLCPRFSLGGLFGGGAGEGGGWQS
ncbi:MAG TPA: hypothetical protein VH619_17455, partial [Verrucomicrobiae bacterium]|nr:hypothetical protein [Verrucomicrobiae bacterium]